ncbi:MAG: hypothetical protein QM715_04120 [Nibricoccus sp.]
MLLFAWLVRPVRLLLFFLFLLGSGAWGVAQEREIEDVTVLPSMQVRGVRMEDLGVRFNVTIRIPGFDTVTVAEVFPNTAAAKAGLKPGELIEKIDGKTPSVWSMAFKPDKLQQRKWAELEAGKKSVTVTMAVRSAETKELRTVTLTLPSAPPRWGSEKWSPPEGRSPAVVKEEGPLAALAREVLDNGIWSMGPGALGYEWRIVQPTGTHRIWVTQQRGKTEITLEHRSPSPELEASSFLTSPSGAMDRGHCVAPKIKGKRREFSAEEVRAEFEAEIDFWLHKVGRVTGRWPFEALSGKTETITSYNRPTVAPKSAGTGAGVVRAESFLKLPAATAEQKELFLTALGKLGSGEDCWAYTETSRSLEDGHVTTVRIDPSKPAEERRTLLKVDGKTPKAAYLKKWRDEGRGSEVSLSQMPPLLSIVDIDDVRICADETAVVVFELPVKASNAEFPADKFQARFRVNKTNRGFEDFSLKLREPLRVAGVAKVTDAGLEARFQMLDPSLAPQLAFLKIGGGARVMLVKISRSIEATRTDFKRVEPFEPQENSTP